MSFRSWVRKNPVPDQFPAAGSGIRDSCITAVWGRSRRTGAWKEGAGT